MILMPVSKSDHIQFLEASRPQVGRNCLFSRIDAAIALSSKTAERPAAIDQQCFAMGRDDEKRIALSNVEYAHLQLPGGPCGRKRKQGDEKRAGYQGDAQSRGHVSSPRVRNSQDCGEQQCNGEKRDDKPRMWPRDAIAPFGQAGKPMHDMEE